MSKNQHVSRKVRSLTKLCRELQRRNPYWSSLVCFNVAVASCGYDMFTRGVVFRDVVEPGDFEEEDREDVLQYAARVASEVRGNRGGQI